LGFTEGKINFRPTFKVLRDQEHGYDEKRSPAWCDRVLWRSIPGLWVEQKEYGSAPTILSSDHKPVFSSFQSFAFELPVGRDDSLGPCQITIHKLRAFNLPPLNEKNLFDPYIIFNAPFIPSEARTITIHKTQNPEWNNKEVPVLLPLLNALPRLAMSFLMVKVFNEETVGDGKFIGSGVLPLTQGIRNASCPTPFSIALTSGGTGAGALEGELTISWSKATFAPLSREQANRRQDN